MRVKEGGFEFPSSGDKTSFELDEEQYKNIIQAVKCIKCGTLHELKSKSYVSVQGNILIGNEGGIVGNNITEDGIHCTYFCKECFIQYMANDLGVKITLSRT